MNEFERHIEGLARHLPYPPTPSIRRWQRTRLPRLPLARALAAVMVVMLAVVMISPLRAAVLEWLQIGVITIFVDETPVPAATLESLVDLYGETTLGEAQGAVRFSLRLPADFGPPDHVYRQRAEGNAVVLVWLAHGDRPALSLYQFGPDSSGVYGKYLSQWADTRVNDQRAVWTDMPHKLQYRFGDDVIERLSFLVRGRVLIWQEGGVTYRLESNLTMAEAVAIAESLR